MRNTVVYLGALALLVLVGAGCANTEEKLGRGIGNVTEPFRLGEMQRSIEQEGLFYGTDVGMTTGFVKGLDKTLARTGVGLYEVVTCPFPPYGPVWTSYLTPAPGLSGRLPAGQMGPAGFRHGPVARLQRRRYRALAARQPLPGVRQLSA
jgi:putative exosortase-associated protein (TIGR04073 family)